jgi:hypothetical protein
MDTFVMIFRQGPRTLVDAVERCSVEETAVWARALNEAGHKLDPRTLTPGGAHRGPDGDVLGNGWAITALLFLEATDLGEAVKIAEVHPALRYGASIEVRHCPRPDHAPRGVVRVTWETVPWVRLGA